MGRGRWGQHRRQRRSGLRARLTRLFALVAILAVGLTSFLTSAAGYQVIARLVVQEGAGNAAQTEGAFTSFWRQLTPEQQQAWSQEGRAARRELGRAGFFSAILSGLLAVGVAAAATRSLTRPLSRLAEGTRRLERGERGWRLDVPARQDELRDLTLAFNASLDSLERQEAGRRALVADVAHDLRTPLAVLRAEIEAMQDGLSRADEAGLGRLHGEVLLLSRLVDDLRTLSLADGGALSLHPERLDAVAVAREVVGAVQARALAGGFEVRLDAPTSALFIHADRARLAQVLYGLLDNALRHTPPGEVVVRAFAADGWVNLSVRDHGPGLGPEALSRAFERFYRADAARSRSGGHAGSGLGLAIVRALVEAQGGQVGVVNHTAGGAVFTLRFPAA